MKEKGENMRVPLHNSARQASFRVSNSFKKKISKTKSSDNIVQDMKDGGGGGQSAACGDSGLSHDTDNQSQHSTIISPTGLKPGLDIQPHMTAALAVMETMDLARSPSLRRISIVNPETEKGDLESSTPSTALPSLPWKKKKKASEQKLIFSFSNDETEGLTADEIRQRIAQAAGEADPQQTSNNDRNDTDSKVSDPNSLPKSMPRMVISSLSDEPEESYVFDESARTTAINQFLDDGEQQRLKRIPSNSNESSGYKSLQVSHLDKGDTASIRSFKSTNTQPVLSQEQLKESSQVRKEKRQRFWDFLTMVSSVMYAFFVVVMGTACYMYDVLFRDPELLSSSVTPGFNMFLSSVGILWLLYLIIDIKRYINDIEHRAFGTVDLGDMKLVEGDDGELHIELTMPNAKKTLPEYYGFVSGRHSGSFYLKIGAGFFCAGHLIHMGINVTKEVIFASYGNDFLREICTNYENMAIDLLIPLFSLLQCYFIFKFGNVIISKNKPLARFALMHCLASCICIWIYTITQETVDALVEKLHEEDKCAAENDDGGGDDDDDFKSSEIGEIGLTPNCTGLDTFHCNMETRHYCVTGNTMSASLFSTASVLYPFSIEFNILVVGVWYILWSNIGNTSDHQHSLLFLPSVTPRGSAEALNRTEGHKEALILFADCKSSINGLFIGISIFVVTSIGAIVIFIMEGSCDYTLVQSSIDMSNILESIILVIMIIVSVVCYFKIAHLEVNPDPISLLDDMLLMICVPMFIVYFVLCIGPTLFEEFEPYYLVSNTLTIIQVFIQTPLIVDGLRRCTISEENQRKLRGRNSLMLLIVLNLAVYLLETLLIKSKNNQKVKMEFYGKIGWTVLSHVSLPLCIFYRFHSSAALVDIWNAAYKPPEHHR